MKNHLVIKVLTVIALLLAFGSILEILGGGDEVFVGSVSLAFLSYYFFFRQKIN